MPRGLKPRAVVNGNGNGRAFNSQASLNSAIKSICDVMRRSNCAGALQYVPELTWILFLRILDEAERIEADNAEAVGATFSPCLASPYRWRDWAAPPFEGLVTLYRPDTGMEEARASGRCPGSLLRLRERGASPLPQGSEGPSWSISTPEGYQSDPFRC